MPRFVLLYHDCPPDYERGSHWDFMLEAGDVLRTWAVNELPRDWLLAHERTVALNPDCPSLADRNAVSALQLGDHRREYLQFEGPLSGNRGRVVRVAKGNYASERESSPIWQLVLSGEGLAGLVTLSRHEGDGANWLLHFEKAS